MKRKRPLKNPTRRKVVNRGFKPVRYQHTTGFHNGWIEKEGRIWMVCYFPSLGRKRLRLDEKQYMEAI